MDFEGLSVLNPSPRRQHGHSLLHELVQGPSDLIAIECLHEGTPQRLSYRDLHSEADALAVKITSILQTTTEPFIVPVLIHQSPTLYVALLAILKAGGAFCPLNIDAPPERVRYILQDVAAKVVLTSTELVSLIPSDAGVSLILVDQPSDEPIPKTINCRRATPDDLAYVMYTSGSTGTPKGVCISHDAVTQALLAHERQIPTFSRFLQFAAPTFDVSVFEIFFPLFRGCTLITAPRSQLLNDLPKVLRCMNVDACELTPTVAAGLLRRRDDVPELKVLLTIGEMLNTKVLEEFGGKVGSEAILWAMYGPTEAIIHCTLEPAISSDSSTGNIGQPLETVSCFVIDPESMDDNGQPQILPIGTAGELAVGGHQLAKGYLNRPEQTSQAFISTKYGMLYRTGDKARLLPGGKLECLGRLSDGQVKLRGQRLELGEVEHAALRTSGCHGVAACVIENNLVVFCATDAGVDDAAVRSSCQSWLPTYMIPGDIVLMRALPQLPSGKVDRNRLISDYKQQIDGALLEMSQPSLDPKENQIMDIISTVLGRPINPEASPAANGVDSLVAIRFGSVLRGSGFNASPTDILNSRSLLDLASKLTKEPASINEQSPSITLIAELDQVLQQNPWLKDLKDQIQDVLPCTASQAAMLTETAKTPGAYCNEIEINLCDTVSVVELNLALRRIMSENEILRTGFGQLNGKSVGLVFREPGESIVESVTKAQDFVFDTQQSWLRPIQIQLISSDDGTCSRMLINIHHSIYDGWSMDMMLSDLSSLLKGQVVAKRPSFRSVLQFDQGSVKRAMDDSARASWAEHLLGWTSVPFPMLVAQEIVSDTVLTTRSKIDIGTHDIRAFCQKFGCTSQVLFQASLAILWSRVSGVSDIVLGSVTSGRTIPLAGIESIMGPCLAALPLRINFNNMTKLPELFRDITTNNRAIMEHCTLPLADIRKQVGITGAVSLYDVLFVYQESLESARDIRPLEVVRRLDRLETKILVEVEPLERGFAIQLTHHSNALSESLGTQFVSQLADIARSLLEYPEIGLDLSSCSWISQLSTYNIRPEECSGNVDLAARFEDVVSRHPGSTAIVFAGSLSSQDDPRKLSYHELNQKANRIAYWLRSRGVEKEHIVPIIMEKSIMLYASILAIVKIGCAYLPLLPSTPLSRIATIMLKAEARHCIVDTATLNTLQSSFDEAQLLDVESSKYETYDAENLGISPDPSRLAYVIYTSGTTGIPKGVAVTQKNIVSNIAALSAIYPINKGRSPRLLQACSQAFDVSAFEIFFTWLNGMCLVAATNDVLFGDLEKSIRDLSITHLSLTPTVAALIQPQHVPSVEFVVTAGEAMTRSVAETWGDKLWQGYGPSETTNICSVKQMKQGDSIQHLGHVLPNTLVAVLELNGIKPVPLGWVGELCFGGDQVAYGYLNEPELTKRSFIKHSEHGRIYRSGDLGRMLADGSLMILGRLDDQIKLRGLRIDVTEVNSTITNSRLANCVVTVLVRRENQHSEQLASFYTIEGAKNTGMALLEDLEVNRRIFAELRSRLPAYMVPSYLIPISEIPRTSSGKLDRIELQSIFEGIAQESLEACADVALSLDTDVDMSELEKSIAQAIANSMGVIKTQIGRWTPFPSIGLDSISAIAVARSLSLNLGRQVSISAILQHPSVAQLSRHMEKLIPVQVEPRLFTFSKDFVKNVKTQYSEVGKEVTAVLPCTPLQEAMLSSREGTYCNKTLLRLRIDSEKLKGYWNIMVQRHDILRTCFINTDNIDYPYAQIVMQEREILWREFEADAPSFQHIIQKHLECLPLALDSREPPLSLALIRYRSSTFLSLVCHHALYDGAAMETLWTEIEDLADGKALPPPGSYSAFMEEVVRNPVTSIEFWQNHFRGFGGSSVFSRGQRGGSGHCTRAGTFDIPWAKVQGKLRTLNSSLLSLCEAAWAYTWSVASGMQDTCFGVVFSGRTADIEGLDRLVAPCFNTIPTRTTMSNASQGIELLKSFQAFNRSALPYQFTPLRKIQKLVSQDDRRLFDTLLLVQQPLKELDPSVWTLEEDSGDMDLPLVCEVVPCPGLNSVAIDLHYDMDLIKDETINNLMDLFRSALKTLLATPYASLPLRENLSPDLRVEIGDASSRQRGYQDIEVKEMIEGEAWSDGPLLVRQVLSDLSGVASSAIGQNTTIFRLGLDSINAVQISMRLRQKEMEVSASDVLEARTCVNIAAVAMNNATVVQSQTKEYDIDKFADDVKPQIGEKIVDMGSLEAVVPCTPMQCGMLTSFFQSSGQNYFNLLAYHMKPHVRLEDLVEALQKIQDQHQILRATFMPIQHCDTSFAMLIHPAKTASVPLDIVTTHNHSEAVKKWEEEARHLILDNSATLPWRVALADDGSRVKMYLLIHHALYDAQSLDLILQDLAKSLRGELLRPSVKPASVVSSIMCETVRGKREARESWEQYAKDVALNTFPTMTSLRVDERKVYTQSMLLTAGKDELQIKTRLHGVTAQAIFQAAWTRVLSSYLGEESVIFGLVLTGRTTEATLNARFPCITTIPIVAEAVKSNRQLLKYMMDFNSNAHKYQFTPLSQIQAWLGHPATSLFDTLLSFQGWEESTLTVPWNQIEDRATVEYPVSIEIVPSSDGRMRINVTAFSDVLPVEQADLLARQLDATIAHLIEFPDENEDDMFRTCTGLHSVLLAVSPELAAPVLLLHQFVELEASLHPSSIALEFIIGFGREGPVKRTWTYEQLNDAGDKVANHIGPGAATGSIVAIHFDKCPEAYFSILGILKAGCAFVALDTSAPMARKEFILRDSRAACLLTDSYGAESYGPIVKTVVIDEEVLRQPILSTFVPDREALPSDTCYCLYTSGTTGTPKGCEITHDNAVQAMMAFQDLFKDHWQPDSRWLQFAALHFDVSILEQYWSWSIGITVVAAPKDLILDDLTGVIGKLGITHIDLTPSLARLTHPETVPSLCKGVFITGGESLKQEILDVWGPERVIYNAYGPTEATIGVTMYRRVPSNGRPNNIGPQFPNVGTYIFRRGTEIPVLKGGIGELCVAGRLVGKGYLNRPDLTEERFPTLRMSGERIYRTGDLVRVLHDGCFEFIGRADDQVKLRGQRLEIGEINHVIRLGVPLIRDVATVVAKHATTRKDVLVSFIVGGKESDSKVLEVIEDEEHLGAQVKRVCRAGLPGYMVPTYSLRLPFIPLSSNNKAEVKQLRRLFEDLAPEELMRLAADGPKRSQVPQHEITKLLETVATFCRVGVDDVSTETSLFDLGIDSITAMQLSNTLKGSGFPAVTPTLIIRNPIIVDLADAITSSQEPTSSTRNLFKEAQLKIRACEQRFRSLACRELGVDSEEIEYIAPCSALQQGMLAREVAEEVGGTYFNTFEMKLHPDTNVEQLRRCWEALVSKHAILRTAFLSTVDGFVQVALKSRARWITEKVEAGADLDQLLEAKRQEWIDNNRTHVSVPLQVIQVDGPDFTRLIVHIFHAIYDGNSFDLMLRTLNAMYLDKVVSQAPLFRDALTHGLLWNYDSSREFWSDHLRGWKPLKRKQSSTDDSSGGTASSTKVVELGNLERVRKSMNLTLQSVVLAVWVAVLQRHRARELTLGLIVAGRSIDLPGVEDTIGPLFNTLPFFNETLHGQSWRLLLQRCHDFNSAVIDSQHVPLSSVQKWCSGGKALFDNLFAFQIEPEHEPEEQLWEVVDGPLKLDYDLAFEATKLRNGSLRIVLVGDGKITTDPMLKEMIDDFENATMTMDDHLDDCILPSDYSLSNTTKMDLVEPKERNQSRENEEPYFEWTETASLLRETIAIAVGVPTESVTANVTLLELGLDSIDVLKLSAMLKRKDLTLTASQMTRLQTIDQMVATLGKREMVQSYEDTAAQRYELLKAKLWNTVNDTGLGMIQVESVLPPTPLQQSMVAGMVESSFDCYFNHDVLEIGPDVDVHRLVKAWEQVIARFSILRTGFCPVVDEELDMAYCQVVFKDTSSIILDISLDDESGILKVWDEAKEEAKQGAGLKGLLQLRFAKLGEQRLLILSIAHALYDGWSLNLMYQHLEAAYHGKDMVYSYSEHFLRKLVASDVTDAKAFWAGYLDGASPSLIAPRALAISSNDKVINATQVSSKRASDLLEFCKRRSISLQVLCQAVWAAVLAHHAQTLDVAFGVVLSGRDFDGAENVMFPTINTVVVRCILHGQVDEYLRYLEDSMVDVREHQTYPLGKALSKVKQGGRLFDSLFMMQKTVENDSKIRLLKSRGGEAVVDYPVCVEVEVIGDELIWRTACRGEALGNRTLLRDLDSVLTFLTGERVDQAQVVTFSESGLSICGLDRIILKDDMAEDGAIDTLKGTFDEQVETVRGIRSILSQVSGISEELVHVSSSIYDLGLDSISAIKVSTLLRKKGIELKPRSLLMARDLRHMAALVELPDSMDDAEELEADFLWAPPVGLDIQSRLAELDISYDEVERCLPASPMQIYMISTWQNSRGTIFYPEFFYEMDGRLEKEKIEKAWEALVDQEPILRTTFLATKLGVTPLLQIIFKRGSHSSHAADLRLLSLSVTKETGQDHWLLTLKIHHALYDGVSLPKIMKRFEWLLNEGEQSVLSTNDVTRWARFCTSDRLNADRQTARRFWEGYLAESSSPSMIMAENNPENAENAERVAYLRRAAIQDASKILAIVAAYKINAQYLFFAALAAVLLRRTDQAPATAEQSTVVFGVYLANRASNDVPTTYPTLNLVPLKVSLAPGKSLMESAVKIQKDMQLIAAEGRANDGLWEIHEWTGIQTDTFVNFLSLPIDDGDDNRPGTQADDAPGEVTKRATAATSAQKVSLKQRERDEASPLRQTGHTIDGQIAEEVMRQEKTLLRDNVVRHTLPPALDVEVSMNGDGGMDIGVFGSRARVSSEEAERMVDDLVSRLQSLVDANCQNGDIDLNC